VTRPPSKWTSRALATLAHMAREGSNSTQIAEVLGNGLTRNAVLGKIHRLRGKGTSLPTSAATPALKPKPKPKPKPKLFAPVALTPRPATLTPYDTIDPKTPGLLRMMDLQAHSCRWPLNSALQGEYYFCGGLREGARPYCPTHVALAYNFRSKTQAQA